MRRGQKVDAQKPPRGSTQLGNAEVAHGIEGGLREC